MATLNEVRLIGNLGGDPKVRDANGTAVCTIQIATNRFRKTPEGDREQITDWHRVVLWGRKADYAGQYLHKGDTVFVGGFLRTRKWQKSGEDHYTTEIVAEDFQSVTPRGARGAADAATQEPEQVA